MKILFRISIVCSLVGALVFTSCTKKNQKPGEGEITPEDTTIVDTTDSVVVMDSLGMRTAKQVIYSIYAGWNLGNTLEAVGGETAWGETKTTPDIIAYVKNKGFNAVRIPCSWDLHAKNGQIDAAWMKRVHEVVDYVINQDMYALINIHWDGGWIENDIENGYSEEVNLKYIEYWQQIATEFADYDDHLLFAALNEPNSYNGSDKVNTATILQYEQSFVSTVRETGGKNMFRTLVLQGPNADIDKSYNYFKTMPTDTVPNRLAMEAHCYLPYTFCGLTEDESWGKMQYYWGDYLSDIQTDRNASSTYGPKYIVTEMNKLQKRYVSNGIPVILGEFGCLYRDNDENVLDQENHHKSVCQWLETVGRESRNHGCVPFYWDCTEGQNFNLINRRKLTLRDQDMYDALMKGLSEGQYPIE